VNDDEANIDATAAFVSGLPGGHRIQLMPFHRLGYSKYAMLNLENPMREEQTMAPEQVEAVRQRIERAGVDCTISK
jgi:pyruvate formate lyase activating enzyme